MTHNRHLIILSAPRRHAQVFFVQADVDLDPNPNEVSEVAYCTPDEVRQLFSTADERGVLVRRTRGRGHPRVTVGWGPPAHTQTQICTPPARQVTPWARHIVERFVFEWWEDLGDAEALSRHVDTKSIHRMGECAREGWADPSDYAGDADVLLGAPHGIKD